MNMQYISTKWKDVKTVVSLATPRQDKPLNRLNSEILNGLIKKNYLDNKDIFVSENSNIWNGSMNWSQLLNNDKYHLSPRGVTMLASNLRNALHTVLEIGNNANRRSRPRYRRNPNYSFRKVDGYQRYRGGNRY